MIRVFFFAFVAAVIANFLSNGNGTIIAIAFFGVLGLIVLGMFSGGIVLKCPYCHKRVKIGATTCHHCGRTVTKAKPAAPTVPVVSTDPLSVPRECEHCKSVIRPDATVCAVCHRDISLWSWHEGAWWEKQPDGSVLRLNPQTLDWENPHASRRSP